MSNVEEQLSVADGAVIGTAFKVGGETWNPTDVNRVREIMQKVKALRS